MTAQHTLGPWSLITDTTKLGVAGDIVTPETTIASVNMWEQTNNPGAPLANARLIAAAPDMLEALRYVETRCVSEAAYPHACIEDRKMRDMVVAAIAKAEGRHD